MLSVDGLRIIRVARKHQRCSATHLVDAIPHESKPCGAHVTAGPAANGAASSRWNGGSDPRALVLPLALDVGLRCRLKIGSIRFGLHGSWCLLDLRLLRLGLLHGLRQLNIGLLLCID